MTLEPPGSIAVVGAGPLGIEAALYGRFLGYDVTLIEAVEIAHSLASLRDQPMQISPDRCLSPLATGAMQSQYPDFATSTKPLTVAQWIDDVLLPLTETDLLRARKICPGRVTGIELVDVPHEEDDPADEIPPDFRLEIKQPHSSQQLDAEAVILATGREELEMSFSLPAPYCFRVGGVCSGSDEADLWSGFGEIVSIYAALAGRKNLDLYQPRRK